MNRYRLSLAAACIGLCFVAHGQIQPPGHITPVHFTEINAIANPGFEPAIGSWNRSFSYSDDSFGNRTYNPNLVLSTTIHHSGSHGAIFKLHDTSIWGPAVNCELQQTLSVPLPGNTVWDASFWAYSTYSNIYVAISYTDGTASRKTFSIDTDNGPAAWYQFDMRSMINAGKTIKAIDFESPNGYEDVVLDDVSLSYLHIDS